MQSTYSKVVASGGEASLKAGTDQDNNTNSIYVNTTGCHSSTTISASSDRRIKSNIDYNYDKYCDFFMALKPASYTYRTMPDNRTHTGFIAQDVEEALGSAGLQPSDFAGLSTPSQPDNFSLENYSSENSYMLAYSEFTSLNTYMIQKLYSRVEALEKELAELRGA